jgi:hypothetical protein
MIEPWIEDMIENYSAKINGMITPEERYHSALSMIADLALGYDGFYDPITKKGNIENLVGLIDELRKIAIQARKYPNYIANGTNMRHMRHKNIFKPRLLTREQVKSLAQKNFELAQKIRKMKNVTKSKNGRS